MRKLLLIALIIFIYLAYRLLPFPLTKGESKGVSLDRLTAITLKLGNKPLKILILLGNDQEIRTNLGFPGSYATMTLNCQLLTINCQPIDVRFADIYTPTGQIQGHVEPPKPIQEAFQQGEWLLPNFDFSPDFPTSAKSFRWFMEKAGVEKFDILATINLSTVKKILDFVGTDSRQTIADLQAKTEVNFFPGSTQKKDALELVGKDLLKKITALSNDDKMKIAKIVLDDLDNGNILLNSSDDSLQTLFNKSNWTGEFPSPYQGEGQGEVYKDFFMMVENNYGANKANCCVSRNTKHAISAFPPLQGGTQRGIHHSIEIKFTNNSPLENPDPPRFYGGNYLSYIRFYIPNSATNLKVSDHSNEVPKNTRYPSLGQISIDKQCAMCNVQSKINEISLFHLTRAGQTSFIEISYDLDIPYQTYNLSLFKQNGLPSSPQEINLFGKEYNNSLTSKSIVY